MDGSLSVGVRSITNCLLSFVCVFSLWSKIFSSKFKFSYFYRLSLTFSSLWMWLPWEVFLFYLLYKFCNLSSGCHNPKICFSQFSHLIFLALFYLCKHRLCSERVLGRMYLVFAFTQFARFFFSLNFVGRRFCKSLSVLIASPHSLCV